MTSKIHTGERLETYIFNENTVKHLHRYAIAKAYTNGKIVLDIASGEGYGSILLCNDAQYVYGVDIDTDTINSASQKYIRQNLEFLVGSASSIPLQDNSVDVVVSFETLEHHDQHHEMMSEIKRVLKADGVLLISTPDKYYYSDLRKYNNPYHIKELYKNEFEDLIKKYFKNHELYSQSYLNGNSIILSEPSRTNFDFYCGNFDELNIATSNPHFLIAICANSNFLHLNDSIFDGTSIIANNLLDEKIKSIYMSNSYRLGHLLLYPFKVLKRIFKSR